jgi:hypothetical protein
LSLIESLEALLEEHDRIGSPLRDRLAQGKPPGEVEAAIRGLGLTPPIELVDLFAWREIQDAPGDEARITWLWPASPLRFEEAIGAYRQSMDVGGITTDELQQQLETIAGEATLTGFWRSDWFPILYGSPETYAVACRPGGAVTAEGPVWRVKWQPDPGFQSAEVAPSLTAFVDRVVELFRAGAYEWSAEYWAIMTVDEVFDRRGLGENGRPWP